jgi:hypothetical protein
MNTNIVDTLKTIAESVKSLSQKSVWDTIIPFLLGLLSSVFVIIISYLISRRQERKAFRKKCLMDFLSQLNEFLYRINKIITDIVSIEKFGEVLLGEKYRTFKYLPSNDYNIIALKIRTFRSYLEANFKQVGETYSSKEHYYKEIIESSETVLDANHFIDVVGIFERSAVNYFYLVPKKIQEKYSFLVGSISEATVKNLEHFDINQLKNYLVEYIREVNAEIVKI